MGGRSSRPAVQRPPNCADQTSSDTSTASSLAPEPLPGAAVASASADRASTKSDVALLDLGSDVLVEILSYLGSGRIEQGVVVSPSRSLGRRTGTARSTARATQHQPPHSNSSCLIRTIPFVNKQLRRLCDASDVLWVTILKRMIRSDPMGWEESVLALVEGRYHMPSLAATSVQSTVNSSSTFGDMNSSPPWATYGEDSPLWRFRVRFKGRKLSSLSSRAEELEHFVDLLCQIVGHRRRIRKEHEQKGTKLTEEENNCDEMSDAKHVTVHLVLSRKVYTLPLLHIPTPSRSIRMGQMIRLDASDPRHRPTVSAITIRQKRRDLRCGSPFSHPPRFVLLSSAVQGRVDAHLVELHRCHLQQSGRRADLFVVPKERIRITDTEERDENDEIVDASFQLNLSLSF